LWGGGGEHFPRHGIGRACGLHDEKKEKEKKGVELCPLKKTVRSAVPAAPGKKKKKGKGGGKKKKKVSCFRLRQWRTGVDEL